MRRATLQLLSVFPKTRTLVLRGRTMSDSEKGGLMVLAMVALLATVAVMIFGTDLLGSSLLP
jgi:hypothetical protein